MFSLIPKIFPKINDWKEKQEKYIIFDFLKFVLFNDLVKVGAFIAIAFVFGVLSNYVPSNTEDRMVEISVYYGWIPATIILLPYIVYGIIIYPIKSLIKKIKK